MQDGVVIVDHNPMSSVVLTFQSRLPSSPAGRRYPLSWQTGYKIQPRIPENRGVSASMQERVFANRDIRKCPASGYSKWYSTPRKGLYLRRDSYSGPYVPQSCTVPLNQFSAALPSFKCHFSQLNASHQHQSIFGKILHMDVIISAERGKQAGFNGIKIN